MCQVRYHRLLNSVSLCGHYHFYFFIHGAKIAIKSVKSYCCFASSKFPVFGERSRKRTFRILIRKYNYHCSNDSRIMKVKRVCVIGAGAAGLAAIRHIKDDPYMEGLVFEQTRTVGGVWNYTDKTGNDEFGIPIHSTMYKNLRTNLPKEIMGFLDFPFPSNDRSYVGHIDVKSYLQKYTDEHNLAELIQFTTRVISVEAEHSEAGSSYPTWKVKTENLQTKAITDHSFDAIMICNGHYTKSFYPDIKNLEEFQGEILHSRDYRLPHSYTGKRVVVLGAGPSAIDISLELAEHCLQVTLCSRIPSLVMPKEIVTKSGIVAARPNTLVTDTGEEIKCDALILCSGYLFDFPFLSPNCGIIVEKGKYIYPLYQHLINAKFPTMVFIGIPFSVCPFPLFDGQIRYCVKVFKGEIILPSEAEMISEIKEEEKVRAEKKIPLQHSHKFGDYQFDYNRLLASEAGVLHLIQPVMEKAYRRSGVRRAAHPDKFKNDFVTIIDSENFEYTEK